MCLAVLKNAKAPGGHLLHNSSALEQQLRKRSCTELGPEVIQLTEAAKKKAGWAKIRKKKVFE